MAIEAITCPNCGASGIQVDSAREHSFCSYCGTALKTKDVLHLDTESMTLEKLKRNAGRSFEVGQYGNARADWVQATQLDRTDYESYWGLVRCGIAERPDQPIGKSGCFEKAIAYAPPEQRTEYIRLVKAHNARAMEYLAAKAKRKRKQDRLRLLQKILLLATCVLSSFALMSAFVTHASWPVFVSLAALSWAGLICVAFFLKRDS